MPAPVQNGEEDVVQNWKEKLTTIWDDDKIYKFIAEDGTHKWRCLWCSGKFPHWNSTKALAHVALIGNKDIHPPCSQEHTFPSQYAL